MSKHTGKTYSFSTLQELVDRVPADRIPECMEELGIMLGGSKAYAELLHSTAVHLAERDGVKVEQKMPDRVLQLPEAMEWIDDGKGDLEPRFTGPDGKELVRLKFVRGEKP